MAQWTFLTNHGATLVLVAQQGTVSAREISIALGLAERSVQRILAELEREGYLSKRREGRTNRYEVALDKPLRRASLHPMTVGELLEPFMRSRPVTQGDSPRRP